MKLLPMLGLMAWCVLKASVAHAYDLLTEIQNGRVEIVALSGNGSSSGTSLQGILRNSTGTELELDAYLPNPIFFDNSSSGQNMVATQVYMGDLGYYTEGERSFIVLAPGTEFPVIFVAYCADFDQCDAPANDGLADLANASEVARS